MIRLLKYGPYICIAIVLAILFILWAFWGGGNYDFIGLAPLDPDTCGSYTGSVYNWGNITPIAGYDPINGQTCVPTDVACKQEPSNLPTNFSADVLDQNVNNTIIPPVANNTDLFDTHNFVCPHESAPIYNVPEPTNPNAVSIYDLPQPAVSIYNPPQPPNPPAVSINVAKPGNKRKGKFISRGQRICRETLERVYGVDFDSSFPNWLRNPETGRKLELDCYNDELKIAVEYNGEQHYNWPNGFNQSYEEFINQVRRDEAKITLCDKNGVYLIVVPYTVPHNEISEFIISRLPETIQPQVPQYN